MSGSISRTYTFTDGTTAYGSQVETEIAAIVNNNNNLDAGTTQWTMVSTGTLKLGVTVVTAAGTYTVLSTDLVVIFNKTVGAATAVTLPASPATGRVIKIKDGKGDAATNNITITPAAGNIDGSSTLVLKRNYGSVDLAYNGTEWSVIEGYQTDVITNWASYTPTIAGFGTVANVAFLWKQIGDTIYVNGKFLTGTVAGSTASITLPNSFTIFYNASTGFNTFQNVIGRWDHSKTEAISANDDSDPMITDGTTTDKVFFTKTGSTTAAFPAANGNAIAGTGDYMFVNFFFIHS